MPWLIPLGLLAGGLTTLAGLGGGLLLTLALAAVGDPAHALAMAAPALLIGNLHRIALFRAHIDRELALRFVAGAAPGALIGGLLMVSLPPLLLRGLLLAAAMLAVGQQLGWPRWRPRRGVLAPVAFAAGAMTATSGGGGLLLGPLLLTAGLRAERFVVTASLVAASIHLARIVGYGAGGLVTAETLLGSALIAVSILAGNLVGRRLRGLLDDRRSHWLTYGVLLVCVGLSVAGLR